MKRNILLLLMAISSYLASAQDNQFKVAIPRTPTAASLGKYGDIPVSYHTGVPNISIPIYTVQEGELSLPISFSYHSSGIKINETASWVGLGWSLNAGGMISRTVIGGRDEGITSGIINNDCSDESGWGWYKDYGLHSKILSPTSGNPNYEYPSSDTSTRAYHKDAANGLLDSEPDIYTYNFGSYTGKFVFDDDRTAYTIPREDMLIEPVNDESEGDYFISWKITTPDGTKFFFGGTGATEQNYSYANGTGNITQQYNTATTWYLYRIESVNGNKWISLEYESEDYSVGDRLSHSIVIGDGVNCSIRTGGSLTYANQYIMLNKVKGKRLSKITTSSGNVEIDFIESTSVRTDLSKFSSTSGSEVNDEAKYLSEIRIKDENDTIQRKYVLDMDYFTSNSSSGYPSYPTITHDLYRLKLESIQEFNGDGTKSKPPYEFTYNSTQMARRFSLACDYWGYYNGATSNQGLIPNGLTNQCNQNTLNGGANRSVSESHMKAWILEKIKYPTGGETSFEYEAHQYNNGDPTLVDIGGLRVSKITKNYGSSQPNVEIEYEYSDARLYTPDPYKNSNAFFWQDPDVNYTLNNYHGLPGGGDEFGELLDAAPKSPLYSTQGYHIGYMGVKEIFLNGGYNHYIYTGEAFSSSYTFPKTPPQNPIGKGQLTTTYYKDSNDSYDGYETNNYTTSTNDISIAAKKITSVVCAHPNHTSDFADRIYCAVTDYTIKTRRHRLLSKISYLDGVTTTTNYAYATADDHGNPIKTTIIDSKGNTLITEYIYPSDSGSGAPAQMYDADNSNYLHMPGVLIQQTNKVNNSTVSKVLHNYTYDSGEDKIHPTSTVTYPSGSSDFISVNYGFDEYDNIATIAKSDGMVDSYYWGYNHSLPVAKISNAEIDNTHDTISDTKTVQTQYTNDITSWTNLGTPLVLDHNQSISININITQYEGTNAHCGVRLMKPDGTTFVFSDTYYPGDSYVNTLVLPAGSYQYQFTMETGTASIVFLTIETNYKYTNIENNIIYESFEDDENASTAYAKTGRKSNYGDYTLQIYADPGTYILSYWQKSNSSAPWVYHEIELVNPPTAYAIASSGQYTDEIRFFPKGAQMETYTHDPGVGVTSITDINNQTIHYEYDDFGRLVKITDPDGNLIQEVEYNFANQ